MPKDLLVSTIGKLRNQLHREIKLRYSEEADVKLTVEEYMILNMIVAKPDQILQEISAATGKNKSVVMRMIDSLEKKGLCRRSVNPTDRRENFLNITSEGERIVNQYQEIERRLSSELLADIPAENLNNFFATIQLISKKLTS